MLGTRFGESVPIDPLGLSSYMRSRINELFGSEWTGLTGLEDVPRSLAQSSWTPDISEVILPLSVETTTATPSGHKRIPGGVEILESSNPAPARPPRRSFRVDVSETDDFYVLRANLAGMTKENVRIECLRDSNVIMIEAIPPHNDFYGVYRLEEPAAEKTIKEGGESTNRAEEEKAENVGQKEPEQLVKQEICHLMERNTNKMSRVIRMPKSVDMDKIGAQMKDGLLVVKFGKREEELHHQEKTKIEIG